MGSRNTGNTPSPCVWCCLLRFTAAGLLCSECSFLKSSHSLLFLKPHKRISVWGQGKQLCLLT